MPCNEKKGIIQRFGATTKGKEDLVDLYLDKCKLLISYGANVNAHDAEMGLSVIHTAAQIDDIRFIETLVRNGARINQSAGYQGHSRYPIHSATACSLNTTKFILAQDPSMLHITDRFGNTPLITASYRGQLDIVKFLTSCPGINLNAQSDKPGGDRNTAVLIAAKEGKWEVVEYLVEACKVDTTLADKDGKTVLDCVNQSRYIPAPLKEKLQKMLTPAEKGEYKNAQTAHSALQAPGAEIVHSPSYRDRVAASYAHESKTR